MLIKAKTPNEYLAHLFDYRLWASFFTISSLALSTYAEIAVDGVKYNAIGSQYQYKKPPDQYQCSQNKNAGSVGIITEDQQDLIQAVATYNKDGVREVSGVLSEKQALLNISIKNFYNFYSMPPISGEGAYGKIPQGNVWNSVAETNVAAYSNPLSGDQTSYKSSGDQTGRKTFGIYSGGMGFPGIDPDSQKYGFSFGYFGSAANKKIEEIEKTNLQRSKLEMTAGDLAAKKQKSGDLAAQTKLPGTTASQNLRAGDSAGQEPLPGTLASQKQRAGDIAGQSPRHGTTAASQMKPGDKATTWDNPRNGDKASWEARNGDKTYYDSLMKTNQPRLGENIGHKGIITFTVLLDQQGQIKKLVYRNGNDIQKVITSQENNDPVLTKIKTQLQKFKDYASCCRNDSKQTCNIVHRPEIILSQPVQNNKSPPTKEDPGHAIMNPFAR